MSHDPRSAIAKLLDDRQPQSLLLLSPDPHGEWHRWCAQHCAATITAIKTDPLPTLETMQHIDMALVIGLIETLDKESGELLIGRLRNVHTEHIYVLIGADTRWRDTDWFSLALQRVDRFAIDTTALTLYGYDLATYHRVRSWNNPKYWANPENWGRYWW